MTTRRQQRPSPPYISFSTLIETLDWLEEEGLPQRFDDGVWRRRGHSGASATQLMGAYRFLGLISPDGSSTSLLERLVFKRGERQATIRHILDIRYPTLEDLDLLRVTASQVEERFQRMGLRGDTLRKAETFFVHAALFSGMSLSPHLTRRSKAKMSSRKESTREDGQATLAASPSRGGQDSLAILLAEARERGPTWTGPERDRWLKAWTAVMDLEFPAHEG